LNIVTIANPSAIDAEPIMDGLMEYGLAQVQGIAPQQWVFHAMDGDLLVGGAVGRAHFSQFYLDALWVQEQHRDKGLGASLHRAVEACAQQQACRRILLNTLNQKAVGFYARLNYVTLAVINGYVDGFDLVYMAKSI
jgi:GNAT superfamily N-acetyltransferase